MFAMQFVAQQMLEMFTNRESDVLQLQKTSHQ